MWKLAVLAARLIGVPHMPDVYVSGDSMWNTYTFGSDSSSFIVLGTAILTNFHDDDLLFVLAREMGHCRAGHALWKTVIRFVAGDIGGHSGMLAGGLLSAISPTKLIGSALEMPLMAWSRQSEVTADRAGLLAIGDVALARRVLLTWSIRSATLLKQVNIDEWMKQEDASADNLTHISEMTTSSTMYTARRLRFLGLAARETEPDALERKDPARAQTAFRPAQASAQARAACQDRGFPICHNGGCPVQAQLGRDSAARSHRLHSCRLHQVSERHADSARRPARQNVTERPLSAMSKRHDVAVETNHPLPGNSRSANIVA